MHRFQDSVLDDAGLLHLRDACAVWDAVLLRFGKDDVSDWGRCRVIHEQRHRQFELCPSGSTMLSMRSGVGVDATPSTIHLSGLSVTALTLRRA